MRENISNNYSKYKIFVINLDRSPDRMIYMEKQLTALNLSFERINAIDGNKSSDDFLNRFYSKKINRKQYFAPLKKAEIGCYISHLIACERVIQENLDYGIILEDDLILESSFALIPTLIKRIPINWNYIKLIYPFKKKRIIRKYPISLDNKDFELVKWSKPPTGTQAYVISYEGAKEFLQKRSIFFRPVDVDLQFTWETSLDIMGIVPTVCKISGVESTIGSKKLKPHYPMARLLYKLKYICLQMFNKL